MRGKLVPHEPVDADPRITPAHAGKTVRCSAFPALAEDHPRACGENYLTGTMKGIC